MTLPSTHSQRDESSEYPPTTGPLLRKVKAKVSRRLSQRAALVLALVGALVLAAALVVPPLGIALILVLPACALVVVADYALHWLKHHPLPPRYDKRGNIQPGILSSVVCALAVLWPYWFHEMLGISPLLAFALGIPNYFILMTVVRRWWAPYKKRSIAKRAAAQ